MTLTMSEVAGDTQLQSQTLEDLSDAVNYRKWLVDLARPYLGDDPIELGSGLGDYATAWLSTVPKITVTDADDGRLKMLTARFVDDPRVDVRPLFLPTDDRGEHSAAVAMNVLEHVEDDVAGLRSISGLLKPGGAVVLIVPAFPSAMSRFDRTIGHFRRYTVASLGATLTAAGLRTEQIRYINPIGLLGWYTMCRTLRRTPGNGLMVRVYDRLVVPLSRRAEQRWQAPFGQSVFAVARTPER
jgi:ubiquinone/menaquinone biosynthesis C-methylase UbiE